MGKIYLDHFKTILMHNDNLMNEGSECLFDLYFTMMRVFVFIKYYLLVHDLEFFREKSTFLE